MSPKQRARCAQRGLSVPRIGQATQGLLLRELYRASIELGDLRRALDIARQRVDVRGLAEIAHHDLARVEFALGHSTEAISAQRAAVRRAPVDRRSFHLWCLATWQQLSGDRPAALRTLRRAIDCGGSDGPLLRAHHALVQLELQRPVPGLAVIIATLRRSSFRQGYGAYLLGRLAMEIGDRRMALVQLQSFLRRNASADPLKALTLDNELLAARKIIATFHSS